MQLKTQKPLFESNITATKVTTQKTTSNTGAKEKARKKSNTMGVRTRSLSQNLQQIFQPFQRGASASLRSSTQSVATIEKDALLSKSNFNFGYKVSNFDYVHQNEPSSVAIPLQLNRNATQHIRANKLNRYYRSKSISAPYVPKSMFTQTSAELNKQLLSKAIAEHRFLVQKHHHYNDFAKYNDMPSQQPVYQNNEATPKLKTRHSKFMNSINLKPFYSRQNSNEEHRNTSHLEGYSQSFDNLLSNDFPTTNKSRKKYSKTKSSTLITKPSSLSLPFGGSCGNLNFSQQKNPYDQSAYRTIHTSVVPTHPLRPTIFKLVSTARQASQPSNNDCSNSDTFDEYDDGSLTDSSSSEMSFEMNSPPVPLKQSNSLSSVPNIQRKPFRSKRADRFTRMQSLDFTQSQTNVPMINPKIKNTSRTVPHSRTGSPVSSPLQSRAVTPTYFDMESRQQPHQPFLKSLNQHQYTNSSMMGGINSMTSYGCHQPAKLTMPMINLPKKSSSMTTMVAAKPKNLNSGTSLSNIVWQNSPLVRHCFKFYYCFVHLDWNTLLMHRIFFD